ncbi:hypothetical protein DL765_010866 [Monosporascus sp. GIB2]|nr:hypothetical protein DL765_010866 [Monosporascus sp. GIB2]
MRGADDENDNSDSDKGSGSGSGSGSDSGSEGDGEGDGDGDNDNDNDNDSNNNADNDNANDSNDDDEEDDDDNNGDIPFAITAPPPKKKKEAGVHRSTGANAIRARPLAAGTFAAGRSAVFGTVSVTGYVHIRLRAHNIFGQPVPPGYRLRGISSVPHRHIVYLPLFSDMSYDQIRREIGRQSLRQGGGQGAAAWVPTPVAREGGGRDASGGGGRDAGDVPARRPRGRPRGSKNKR